MGTPLLSARHEAFAEAVASGMAASKAYSLAYARPRNGATRSSAARLLTKANVRPRIAELVVRQQNKQKRRSEFSSPPWRSVLELLSRPGG
jgi:hypothetical protein